MEKRKKNSWKVHNHVLKLYQTFKCCLNFLFRFFTKKTHINYIFITNPVTYNAKKEKEHLKKIKKRRTKSQRVKEGKTGISYTLKKNNVENDEENSEILKRDIKRTLKNRPNV